MKVNELRIGNLLYYDNEVREICSIHSDNTIRFKDKEKGSIGCFSIKTPLIKPIQLTEEWLLKLGFTKLDGCFGFETQRGNLIIEEDLCEITGNYNDIGFNSPCKYVHQLQNLYFALTGEELAKV